MRSASLLPSCLASLLGKEAFHPLTGQAGVKGEKVLDRGGTRRSKGLGEGTPRAPLGLVLSHT